MPFTSTDLEEVQHLIEEVQGIRTRVQSLDAKIHRPSLTRAAEQLNAAEGSLSICREIGTEQFLRGQGMGHE